jgi:cytochrome c oxidase subunit 2
VNDFLRHLLFLPDQASTISTSIDHLHFFIILTTFAGSIFVFGLTAFFVIRYRRRSEEETTPQVVASRTVELLYIGGPLALFLLWFAIGYAQYVKAQTPPADAMDVYVTAKQWMWKFSYPGGPNAIGTLTVPTGRPVRLLLTSRDVIHSFFVPAFRLKQDALPGRYTQLWFQVRAPGRWRIMCAEYCGLWHSQMWGEVVALSPADYGRWREEQRRGLVAHRDEGTPGAAEPASTLATQGERVAMQMGCPRCHTVDGTPHIGPTWLDLYMRRERLTDGHEVVADEAYLTESMMRPEVKIVAGFQPVMPSYEGQLQPADAAALVEYIKSLRSPRLDRARSEPPVYEPAR